MIYKKSLLVHTLMAVTVCLLYANQVSSKTKTYEDLENMKQEASKHIDRQVAGNK